MSEMAFCNKQIGSLLFLALLLGSGLLTCSGHGSRHHHHQEVHHSGGSRAPEVQDESHAHYHCDHGHDHHHHHHDEHDLKLPEELAEEEDLKLYGFGSYNGQHHLHDHEHFSGAFDLSGLGLWINALGCSLLVSMASLVCLIILPVIFVQGRPSKGVVDSLALFGAGAMLGDAFLHQIPHAFGGEHPHSHDHHDDHSHNAHLGHEHSHAHSLKDLSVGLSILAGIVLFLLVEKVVRYVEENSGGANAWSHGHDHHHHHKNSKKWKHDDDSHDKVQSESHNEKKGTNEKRASGEVPADSLNGDNLTQAESLLRKRGSTADTKEKKAELDTTSGLAGNIKALDEKESPQSSSSLVFGYLNLFSDGVHNFTDGMAIGSAFLLYGSVGGWSRTLFLLAHELPQEVGDFGILVRSGFSVSNALFFNFLSALVALIGTALALLLGQGPGQSSLIEGFTAGGFIYIAVAGVLAEMNNNSKTTLKSMAVHSISLISGMTVALCISLVE